MSLRSRVAALLGRAGGLAPHRPAPVLDFGDPAIAQNPFPHWEALRAKGPVHFLPRSGGWLVLGYGAVKEALARPDLFSNAPYAPVDAVLLGEDPPRQAATRRLVSRHFTAEALGRLERVAGDAAREALGPRLDAVAGFAQPVSRAVAGELIGFDAAALVEICEAADAAAGESLAALIAALDVFGPRAGIYPQLLREGDGLIGEAEARSLVRLLWLASNTTTERVIVRCVLRMVEEPQLQRAIRRERALLPGFIEEVMRLHPPEHVLPRMSTSEAELGGCRIPANAVVYLCVGAANRDPEAFDAPAELRPERGSKRHFAFGSGIHHCVGAPLARRVIAAALGTLLDASPELRAAEPLDELPLFASLTALAPTRLEIAL